MSLVNYLQYSLLLHLCVFLWCKCSVNLVGIAVFVVVLPFT